jgi:hypothetical protein
MNKTKTIRHIATTAVALAVTAMTSCVNYDDVSQAIEVNVQLALPTGLSATTSVSGKTVTMQRQDGTTLTAQTDADGTAHFTQVVPDIYTISSSWSLSADEYAQASGDNGVTQGATISGNLSSQLLAQSYTAEPLTLPTLLSINRSMVISKVYYAGCKDNNNKNYLAGRYLELYNQSDDTLDIAGYYIGLIESNSTPAFTLEQLHERYADSVVLLKQVFQIPTAQPYLVKPGGTVLLTNSATDHRPNAAHDFDLTGADFEAKDASGKTNNNPDVEALSLTFTAYSGISNMNMVQSGPNSIVLFQTDIDLSALPLTYNYGKTKGTQSMVLPKRYVLDAVEILKYKNTGDADLSTKRFYDELDASYTCVNATNGYNGEAVYRKTSSRTGKDGHKILEDTNNSTNDFKASQTIQPRQYD